MDANANEGQRDDHGLFQELKQLGLCDLATERHQGLAPSTYNRGKRQIDYIMGSRGVLEHVAAAGIVAYNTLITSDHRSIFVDINMNSLMGRLADHAMIVPPSCRGISSRDPEKATKFRSLVIKYMEDHQVEQRISMVKNFLERPENAGLLQQDHVDQPEQQFWELDRSMNRIDKDITRAFLSAERRLRRKSTLPWSPKLMKARALLRYWRARLTEATTGCDLRVVRLSLTQEAGLDAEPANMSAGDIAKQCHAAHQNHRKVVKAAAQARHEHLLARAHAHAEAYELNAVKVCHRMAQQEDRCALFYKIKARRGKLPTAGIDSVIISTDQGTETVTDPAKVEQLILARNRKHFGQAQGTPFTRGHLASVLGWHGTNRAARDVLANKSQLTSTEPATAAILDFLRTRQSWCEIPPILTTAEVVGGFRKWKESTSTSPSGRHLGTYKAILAFQPTIRELPITETTEVVATATEAERIFHCITVLLNGCAKTGLTLHRWQTIVSAMLEKIPGQPRIDKLRVIHLMEADFNLFLGIFWGRKMLWENDLAGLLGDQQWGSRSGRSANDALLLQHLILTCAHLKRHNCATFDNDASACYDRIVTNLLMMRSQQLGLPASVCHVYASVLDKAKFYVKTGNGVSEDFYCNTPDTPIIGALQGSKGAPPGWGIISIMLMMLTSQRSTGLTISTPDGQTSLQRTIEAFVDDTNGLLNDSDDPKAALLPQLRQLAQWWEQLLHASGGKLALDKCFYYFLDWQFDAEGRPHLQDTVSKEEEDKIKLQQSCDGQEVQIAQKAASDWHRTLGFYECPAFEYSAERARLQEKADDLAHDAMQCRLNYLEMQVFHDAIYTPSIGYTLPLNSLSRQEAENIQKKVVNAMLNGLGYNRHMPRAVVFGPQDMGGIGLRHLYFQQGGQHVLHVIKHLRHGGTVGKAIQITLAWVQLVCGTSYPVLADPKPRMPHAVGPWFITLRDYLNDIGGSLYIKGAKGVAMRREHDQAIMDIVVADKQFTKGDICLINRYRIFLQVETVSEIATAFGDAPLKLGPGQPVPSISCSSWPRQERPGPNTRRAWLKLITSISDNGKLKTKLGAWHNISGRRWPALYDCNLHIVVVTETGTGNAQTYWKVRARRGWLSRPVAISERPEGLQADRPIDWDGKRTRVPLAWTRPATTSIDAASNSTAEEIEPTSPGSFSESLKMLDKWEADLLAHHEQVQGYGAELAVAMRTCKPVWLVHDGGAEPPFYGSFGWVIATEDKILWQGSGTVPGFPIHSFRAEAYGRIAGMSFIRHYCKYYQMEQSHPEFRLMTFCDNMGLIRREQLYKTRRWVFPATYYLKMDMDTTLQIEDICSHIPLVIDSGHVKGHQDKVLPEEALSREARLNIVADKLASKALRQISEEEPCKFIPLPGNPVYLKIKNQWLSGEEVAAVYKPVASREMIEYLQNRNQWSDKAVDLIDWSAYRRFMGRQRGSRRRFIAKTITRWLPTATRLHRFSIGTPGLDDKCVECGEVEDFDHLWLCRCRRIWKEGFMKSMERHMWSTGTKPELNQYITQGLRSWLFEEQSQADDIYMQHEIGWMFFPMGFISSTIVGTQDTYSRNSKQGKLGEVWATSICDKMWEHLEQGWEARNRGLHEPEAGKLSKERKLAEAKAKQLYEMASQTSSHLDGDIFNLSLEERLQLSTKDLQKWAKSAEPAIDKAVLMQAKRLRAGQQSIRRFLENTTNEGC